MKGKKTGGRTKGTPNRATAHVKSIIMSVIDKYSEQEEEGGLSTLEKDILKLEPRDRARIIVDLMKIIMPKNISIDDAEVSITIDERLKNLSEAKK